MSLQLEDKTALITGAASGIGRAVATRFLAEGANVVAFDQVESIALGDIKAGAFASMFGDVRSAADNQRAVDLALSRFGALDIFVGNAGLYDNRRAFRSFTAPELDAAFDELFGVDVKGYLLGALAAADALAKARGCILFTSSVSGTHAGFGGALYVAAKHAVNGLTKQLALELAPDIRVNAVAPGYVPTGPARTGKPWPGGEHILAHIEPGAAASPSERRRLCRRLRLSRVRRLQPHRHWHGPRARWRRSHSRPARLTATPRSTRTRMSDMDQPAPTAKAYRTPRPHLVSASARIASFAAGDLMAEDGSAVDRRLFVDPDIYRLEQERIFAKCWLYLGHESTLAENQSFFTTTMGEDPVIVVRDKIGRLRAFLNSCSHRGAKVCRVDSGTARFFKCPYHSWTFSTEGELIAVPRINDVYGENLDRSKHGLREVPHVDTFGGMIFANWDPAAATLHAYLGDMAFYLELMLSRMDGGTEAIGGVHKWTIDVNWKIPAENRRPSATARPPRQLQRPADDRSKPARVLPPLRERDGGPGAMSIDASTVALWQEVEAFYRVEVLLLQARRYRDWLATMDPAISYRVPVTTSTLGGLVARDDELGYYDDDFKLLEARVAKLESKQSWVEQPPSRLRYFVHVVDARRDGASVLARSNLLLVQNHWNMEQHFSGELVPVDGGFRLRRRRVVLDRQVLGKQGLSVFF